MKILLVVCLSLKPGYVFDASRIFRAEGSFELRRISKIVTTGRGVVATLAPLIVHEDNHQLVIFKPAGWLSQADESGDLSVNEIFAAYLREKYQKPGNVFCAAVQRLDRPASGLMVLARTSKGAARISEQIRLQTFGKRYRVLTDRPLRAGDKKSQQIVLMADMAKVDRMARKVDHTATAKSETGSGKQYILTARALRTTNGLFAYDVEIEGGKFHQVRALFATAGSPLLGDVKYGGSRLTKHRDRIALVCTWLNYQHPTMPARQIFALSAESLKALPSYFI